jgi:hypothetical protein
MKSLITAFLAFISLKALAFDPVYPVKNLRYISERDYRQEVLESDKYVVMVFSSDDCLERTIVERSCWLFEKKLDYYVPKFSSRVKVVGFNTYFENYIMVRDFHIKNRPTVVVMIKGQAIKRFEPVYQDARPYSVPYLHWQDRLLKDVLSYVGSIH